MFLIRFKSPTYWWSSSSKIIEVCLWSVLPWVLLAVIEFVLRNIRLKRALLSEYTPAIDLAHLVPSFGVTKRISDFDKDKVNFFICFNHFSRISSIQSIFSSDRKLRWEIIMKILYIRPRVNLTSLSE